jgi:very-short-patch-repair endonuclease
MHPKALTGLKPQHKVGVFRIDFAVPRIKVGIELDGYRDHSSSRDITNDLARQRQLGYAGWYIVRFGGSEVYHNPEQCVRDAARMAAIWGQR